MSIARRLLEILIAKSSTLAGMRRQKNQSLADFTAVDIANFWLLYTVNSHLPLLRHIFETRRGHPEALFSVMSSLAGALTTFSLKLHPRDLPRTPMTIWDRASPTSTRSYACCSKPSCRATSSSLPLKLVQPSIYATAHRRRQVSSQHQMYLAVSAEIPEAELIAKTPQLIKICSADSPRPSGATGSAWRPPDLMCATPAHFDSLKLNYQYFSLSQVRTSWEAILRARNLAAYVPGDFPNPQLELIILLPTT